MMILMIILNVGFKKKKKKYAGSAQQKRNLNLRLIKKIRAVFHNLQN